MGVGKRFIDEGKETGTIHSPIADHVCIFSVVTLIAR